MRKKIKKRPAKATRPTEAPASYASAYAARLARQVAAELDQTPAPKAGAKKKKKKSR